MRTQEQLEQAIFEAIRETLIAKGVQPPALNADVPLDQSLGLDSLDWAAVVVRLEESTGLDPFRHGVDRDLRKVGDLTVMYAESQ